MASIISFFVLLFITYSYSVPVEKVYDSSTVHYDFTTDKTMADQENTSAMKLMYDEQSTSTPDIHKKRFNPVDIPPKQTMEEHHTDKEPLQVQDMTRRQNPSSTPLSDKRSTDDEDLIHTQDVNRRQNPPLPPLSDKRSTDDEDLIHTQDVNRRQNPPIPPLSDKRSTDDEDLIHTQDVNRRQNPPRPPLSDKRSTDDEELLHTQDIMQQRVFEDSSFPSTTIKSTLDYSSTHEENDKRCCKDEFSVRALETSTEFNRRAISPIITETSNESQDEIQLLTRILSENNIETTTNVESSSANSVGKMTGLLHDQSNEVSTTTTQSSFVTEQIKQLSQGQKQPVTETTKSN